MKAIDALIEENDKLQEEIEKLLKEVQKQQEIALFYKTILENIKKENEWTTNTIPMWAGKLMKPAN